jgi:hypothetical protein
MFWAAMPETAINEDNNLSPREHNVASRTKPFRPEALSKP